MAETDEPNPFGEDTGADRNVGNIVRGAKPAKEPWEDDDEPDLHQEHQHHDGDGIPSPAQEVAEGAGKEAETQAATSSRFILTPFNEIELKTSPPYLVKGLVPREGLVVVWGPPKCGKSFWTYDLSMHVALGWEYRGRKVAKGPVIYIACEGERGLGARTEAYRQRHLAEAADPVDFYLATTRIDLIRERGELIDSIVAQVPDKLPLLVVIDTLNRSLVGHETDDMAHYVQAADEVWRRFGCAIIVIHHCGIDDTRPRGSTSLSGAADAQIAVKKEADGTVLTEVELMKDGPEGEQTGSRLEVVEVGIDDDGDPITSCVIVPAEVSTTTRKPKVTGQAQIALDLLRKAIAQAGKITPASNHIPGGQLVVSLNLWRDYCKSGGLAAGDNEEAFKKAWQRVRDKLLTTGNIRIWSDLVWLCDDEGDKGT